MRILAHLTFAQGATLDAFLPHRAAEAQAVWTLYKAGTIRDAALRADNRGALLTFEADTPETVAHHLDTFPAVKAGLFTYELIPLAPFTSWEALFRQP